MTAIAAAIEALFNDPNKVHIPDVVDVKAIRQRIGLSDAGPTHGV